MKKFLVIGALVFSLFFTAPVLAVANDIVNQFNAAAGQSGAGYDTSKTVSPDQIAVKYIKIVLSFVGMIFLVLTIYAGIMWMTAGGNDEQVEKAKKTLTRSVIGLIIITSSYSISLFAEKLATGKTDSNKACIQYETGPCCQGDPCWNDASAVYKGY